MKIFILLSLLATLALAQPGLCPEERVPYAVPRPFDYELSFTELSTPGYDILEDSGRGTGNSIRIEWPYAYISCMIWGLMVWDISDPYSPHMLSHTYGHSSEPDLYLGLGDFDIYQDTLLVGELGRIGSEGLIIVNVADVYDPEVVFTYEIPGHAHQTLVYGDFAFQPWAEFDGFDWLGLNGIISFDLTNPSYPIFADSIRTPSHQASWLSIDRDVAYVFDRYTGVDSSGIYIVDVSDPYDMLNLNYIPYEYLYRGWAYGGYLYCIGSLGSTVYDVSDPTDSVVVTTFPGFPTYSLTFDWPYLYCATGAGIVMVDISVPESTHIAGWQAFSQAWHGTGVSDSSLLLPNGDFSFGIYRWENTGIEEQPPKPDEYSISAYPNPFNSSVTISISGVCDTPLRIEICDINGRLVETLTPLNKGGCPEGTGGILSWQPSPSLGSGVYLVRATVGPSTRTGCKQGSGTETATARLVYLK